MVLVSKGVVLVLVLVLKENFSAGLGLGLGLEGCGLGLGLGIDTPRSYYNPDSSYLDHEISAYHETNEWTNNLFETSKKAWQG